MQDPYEFLANFTNAMYTIFVFGVLLCKLHDTFLAIRVVLAEHFQQVHLPMIRKVSQKVYETVYLTGRIA